MRENYNGFTLVELLAIIVILAIIALITTPVILNVIENSRLNAAKDKAWGTIDAVKVAYAAAQTSEQEVGLPYTISFPKTSASDSSTDSSTGGGKGNGYINNTEVKASGENPTGGSVTLDKDGSITAKLLKFGNYYCSTIDGKNGKLNSNKVYCSRISDDVIPNTEKAVYVVSKTSMNIGQAIPSDVTVRSTPSEAMKDWANISSANNNVFLKHVLVDDKISETYVGFVITEENANANDGMVAGTYYLKGGSDSYDSNVAAIKKIFDYDNHTDRCYYSNEWKCRAAGITVQISDDFRMQVIDGDGDYYCSPVPMCVFNIKGSYSYCYY